MSGVPWRAWPLPAHPVCDRREFPGKVTLVPPSPPPRRRAAPGGPAFCPGPWSRPLPSGPGLVVGAPSQRHHLPLCGCGSLLAAGGFLQVLLLGSLSWKCSSLIPDCEPTFPGSEAPLPRSLPRPPSLQAPPGCASSSAPLGRLRILRTLWCTSWTLVPLPSPGPHARTDSRSAARVVWGGGGGNSCCYPEGRRSGPEG